MLDGYIERSSGNDGARSSSIEAASLTADCSVTIFGFLTYRAKLTVNDETFAASIEEDFGGLLKLNITLAVVDFNALNAAADAAADEGTADAGEPLSAAVGAAVGSDFSLSAAFSNDFLDYLGKNVTKHLKSLVASFDRRLSDAQASVTEWETAEKPKLDQNNAKIAAQTAKDEAAIDEDVKKVRYRALWAAVCA